MIATTLIIVSKAIVWERIQKKTKTNRQAHIQKRASCESNELKACKKGCGFYQKKRLNKNIHKSLNKDI